MTGSATSPNLNCLKGKIASLSPYAFDKTLSVEGSAADSKAVGDALDKKVSYSDIVDDLTTSDSERPLSAKQGVELKKTMNNLSGSVVESLSNMEQDIDALEDSVKTAQNSATSASNLAKEAQQIANSKMAADGSVAMTNDFNMGENKIINVLPPDNPTDAANKEYVDSKRLTANVTLKSTGWATTTGSAPYSQTVALAAVLATDVPHVGLIPSEDTKIALEQEESWGSVSRGVADDGVITFTCYEERPKVDLNLQIEVNR